jgi:hypothetical protein
MKNFNLSESWPILAFVSLFLVLPLSTIPGMFDFIFVVLGLITLVIAGLIVWTVVAQRTKTKA